MDQDIPWLAQISDDFFFSGISSMDSSKGIIVGRPHGGLAILYKKSLASYCKIKCYDDSRLMGLEIRNGNNKLLLINCYLPCCSLEHLDEYQYYLAKIDNIISTYESPFAIAMGDFNADITCMDNGKITQKFGYELTAFCQDEGYIMSDKEVLSGTNTYTFVSSSHASTSWLDHLVCTAGSHDMLNNVYVKYDLISSDHKPLCAVLNLSHINVSESTQGDEQVQAP